MNDNQKAVLDDLATTLSKIKQNKVFGSVEIYFEDGEITQITQRIINKVKKQPVKTTQTSSNSTRNTPHKTEARSRITTLE